MYMTQKDQVFIVDVVIINPMRKTMISGVINQPTNVVAKLSVITNIHKYKGLHEGHHFISMAMELHNAFRCDMNHFIKECARLFHDRQLKNHLSLFFCIQFFKQHVNIAFQHVLAFAIKRNITLVSDVCSRLPITITFHVLHVDDIRVALGEVVSFDERDRLSPFFLGSCRMYVFWLFFGLPFLSPLQWFRPSIFYWIFVTTSFSHIDITHFLY